MAAKVKTEATKARDKRLRRNAAETRAAGLRSNVTVRLTPEERASLESYAAMRGITLSEAIRSRACHYSPDAEKAAQYAKRLYYGMRENGADLMESNRAVRIAYEENARCAFALSTAVRRVGVNVNQIAKRVNSGGFEDAGKLLAELQNCVSLLNEILETGNVSSVRPIPPLETGVPEGVSEAPAEPAKPVAENARKEPSGTVVETTVERGGSGIGNDAGTASGKKREAKQKTRVETKQESDTKPKRETKQESDTKPKRETKQKTRAESKQETKQKTRAEPKREPPAEAARPQEASAPRKPERQRVVPLADASKGESQEEVDAKWVLSLLEKKGSKDGAARGEMSEEAKERLLAMVSADMPKW